jgi:hypothetical protein
MGFLLSFCFAWLDMLLGWKHFAARQIAKESTDPSAYMPKPPQLTTHQHRLCS